MGFTPVPKPKVVSHAIASVPTEEVVVSPTYNI